MSIPGWFPILAGFARRLVRVTLTGLLALSLALGLVASSHAQAPGARSGNIIYTPPRGWTRLNQNGATVFVPSHLIAGEGCLLAILADQRLNGDFRAWFDAALKKSLSKGERVVKHTAVVSDRAGAGYKILYTVRVVQNASGQRSYRFYFAAHPGDRVAMIVYVATSQAVFQRYQQPFLTFLGQLRFANVAAHRGGGATPAPLPTAPPPALMRPTPTPGTQPSVPATSGLSGLYVTQQSRSQFNSATGYYDYIVTRTYYLFYSDGRVYYGLPLGGLDSFDFTQAQQSSPNRTGHYTVAQGQILFRWDDGSSSGPEPIAANGSSLQIGTSTYSKVLPDDGLRLDGTYTSSSFVNTSGGGQESGVSGETRITFTPDGRFSEQGFSGFAGTGSQAGGTTSTSSGGAGTYSLSGNTLTLHYSGNGTQRLTFLVYPGYENGAHPGFLIIDGAPFLPQ